jgi:hypothetical protein
MARPDDRRRQPRPSDRQFSVLELLTFVGFVALAVAPIAWLGDPKPTVGCAVLAAILLALIYWSRERSCFMVFCWVVFILIYSLAVFMALLQP